MGNFRVDRTSLQQETRAATAHLLDTPARILPQDDARILREG
jgi:hypothetical protein